MAVLRGESYDGDLEGLLVDGLRLVEADVRGRSVVLKPNFVEFLDGTSDQHRPALIVAAADALRRLGASLRRRRRGPGAPPRHRSGRRARRACCEALDDAGLRVRRPQRGAGRPDTARAPATPALRELWVPKLLRDADVVVSMPKLKTHHWVGVTLSLKNCFGCMPGRVYGWPKDVFHVHDVPNSILDIVGAVRPSLAIIDGIVGMEGDGPLIGDTGARRASSSSRSDPVAADVTGARLMGMEPEKIEYLMEAGRFLGQARSELIEQRGEDPERLAKRFAPAPGLRAHRRVGASLLRPAGPDPHDQDGETHAHEDRVHALHGHCDHRLSLCGERQVRTPVASNTTRLRPGGRLARTGLRVDAGRAAQALPWRDVARALRFRLPFATHDHREHDAEHDQHACAAPAVAGADARAQEAPGGERREPDPREPRADDGERDRRDGVVVEPDDRREDERRRDGEPEALRGASTRRGAPRRARTSTTRASASGAPTCIRKPNGE